MEYKLALHYPRVVGMLERYCGNAGIARRFLRKAVAGEELYLKIVREAFARRHQTNRGIKCREA